MLPWVEVILQASPPARCTCSTGTHGRFSISVAVLELPFGAIVNHLDPALTKLRIHALCKISEAYFL